MHIRINDFAGTFPKVHPTKLPDYASLSCVNVMVDSGILEPTKEATTSEGSGLETYPNFKSAIFFQYNDITYKKFSRSLVRFNFSPVHDSYRLYWTKEDGDGVLMFSDWDIGIGAFQGQLTSDGFEYIAGMPAPKVDQAVIGGISLPPPDPDAEDDEQAYELPTELQNVITEVFKKVQAENSSGVKKKEAEISDAVADVISDLDKSIEARVYAFTYVNTFGDESAPGVIEKVIFLTKGESPTITIPYAAGEREALVKDYGVDAIRVYRSVTNSLGVAQFLFVKHADFALLSDGIAITDDLPQGSVKIGEPMVTMNYDPPRDNMKGLGVTDSGVGYGYVERTICLSEPYTLYAWPRYYELSSQHDVMGLGHYDDTIVVATKGNPMLIAGSEPESMGILSLPLYEGCVSSRSMVNLNYGCMYASNNGLVLVTTNSAKLLTENVFSAQDWQKIKPSSIHASAYKNGYLFFWDNGTEKGSGYIDLNNGNKGVMWFDDHALNTFMNDGILQMIDDGVIAKYKTFNPEYGEPTNDKVYKWQSKLFNIDTPRRMLAAQVIADDYSSNIIFRVYGNGVLIHESLVKDARPFRVSNHSVKYDFSIEVEAGVSIREIAMGETMRDLIV